MNRHQWVVTGRIAVRHGLPELRRNLGETSPVPSATVRVKSRKRIAGVWGTWGTLGEDVTGMDGGFRVFTAKDRAQRQFKVEVKLRRSSFAVFGENKNALSRALVGLSALGPNPGLAAIEAILAHTGRATLRAAIHEVHRDQEGRRRRPGQHNLGDLRLNAGIAQAHGDIWVLFEMMRDRFKRNNVPFRGFVGVKYPHNNALIGDGRESSYCNPFNRVCYIIANSRRNQLSTRTILHELMHAWAFGNSTGETGMAWQLLSGSDRAREFNKTFVPFHEAFADWGARWVEWSLLRDGAADPQLAPLSRQGLVNEGIDDADAVEHFLDGWLAVFDLLTTSQLDRFDFNVQVRRARARLAERCNTPRVPFFHVLRAFRAHRRQRLDQISKAEMRLRSFLRRIALTDGSVSREAADAYAVLLDASATAQPWELFCR